jgi:hypothetical protein
MSLILRSGELIGRCNEFVALRSFALPCVIPGIDHIETVSDSVTDGMNMYGQLDDKTYSHSRPSGAKDDGFDSTRTRGNSTLYVKLTRPRAVDRSRFG